MKTKPKSKKETKVKKPLIVKRKTTTLREETGNHDGNEVAELKKQLRIAQKKLAKQGKSSEVDVQKVAAQAAAEARKAAMKDATKGNKAMQKQLAELLAENKRAKIKVIKARLMKQYGNRLISALLVGETKEELEAAAVRAHKAWKSAVKGVGHPVDEDEDEEDTDTEDEEEEDDEDSEVDNDDEEDEEDEDEEEETTPSKKSRRTGENNNGVQRRAPDNQNRTRTPLPEMPSINGRGGGLQKSGRNAASLLKQVHAWSPEEYRKRRGEVKSALSAAYPKQ